MSISGVGHSIIKFELQDYIKYWKGNLEESIREYLTDVVKSKGINIEDKEFFIKDKDNKHYGLDIYFPDKKFCNRV